MGLVITDGPSKNGTYTGAKGGTEMMMDGLRARIDPQILDQFNIICSRATRESIDPSKINLFWAHDRFDDPAVEWMNNGGNLGFDRFIFVSNHQLNEYNKLRGVSYDNSVVLKNAIVPLPWDEIPVDGPVRLIYHTTPHRGLEILVPVYEKLYEHFGDRIHLDVYSSFKIYGWEHRDRPYEELFERCKNHPGITYHGTVSNDEIREALLRADIFAYPCIWPETSCLSAIEAMSARCLVVAPNLGALPETMAGFGAMYQWTSDMNEHARIFAMVLSAAIMHARSDVEQQILNLQKQYTDLMYNWDQRAEEWRRILEALVSARK